MVLLLLGLVLILLWLVFVLTALTLGGFIYLLLIVGIIMIIIRLVRGSGRKKNNKK